MSNSWKDREICLFSKLLNDSGAHLHYYSVETVGSRPSKGGLKLTTCLHVLVRADIPPMSVKSSGQGKVFSYLT